MIDVLGDKDVDWRFAEHKLNDEGDYIAELNQSIDFESLINLENNGEKTVTVFNPDSEMVRDSLVDLFRTQLKVNDGSLWRLSEAVVYKGELIAPALSDVDTQLLLTLRNAGVSEIKVHSVDGAAAEDIARRLFKTKLRSEESVKWHINTNLLETKHGPVIHANERLSPSSLVAMAVNGAHEFKVYRSVTFGAARVMERKHGIKISDGYVLMRTSELKNWVLANDVFSSEGEFLLGFNERLSSEDDDVDVIADLIGKGVRNFKVFFIDDNHFSFSLRNTLKADQGKQQENLESATAAHPYVREMLEFIEEANELNELNGNTEANAFGYRADLPEAELAQMANSLRIIYSKIRPATLLKLATHINYCANNFSAQSVMT